ncbi:MAG: RagB/SusD family nutrient uptake outer membrane protein [Bacteroidales bacterium]|nr:RagB/SusD family nutrient uptake outer membrane protein [Bacteroidales bacterium]
MKLKHIISAAGIALMMTSCQAVSDWIERQDTGDISFDAIWQDDNYVEGFLNNAMIYIPVKGFLYSGLYEPLFCLTDDGWSSDDGSGLLAQIIYQGIYSAESHPLSGDRYADLLERIRNINIFLEHIVLPETAVKNESSRNRMIADAHTLRAFYMTELFKWYGPLPIMDKPTDLNTNYANVRRATPYEYAKFICNDCDIALTYSDFPWRSTNASDAGRMHKGVAMALKSTVMLMAASPLFNRGENHWEEAYEVTKAAVDSLTSHGYALFTKCTSTKIYGNGPASAWRQYNAASITLYSNNPTDKETIYVDKTGTLALYSQNYVGSELPNLYKCGTCPTQELVDAYETTDGVPVLNLERPYLDDQHLKPNFNPNNKLYDEKNPYANRDPRFEQTILHQGSTYTWDATYTLDVSEGGLNHRSSDASERSFTRTGYYYCKTITPNCSMNQPSMSPTYKHYRLSELYLNYAEAAAEAGHLEEARSAVNVIRSRVKMPNIPAGLSAKELLLRIKNERRVELACEEHRFFDLRRWCNPDETLESVTRYATGVDVTFNSDSTETYYTRVSVRNSGRAGYESRNKLLPIPKDEASLMNNLTGEYYQNLGW